MLLTRESDPEDARENLLRDRERGYLCNVLSLREFGRGRRDMRTKGDSRRRE